MDQVVGRLDGLDHAGRVAEVERCGLAELGRLYELAAASPPITARHFVGDGEPLRPVAHDGWNSLPLPAFGRRFQKVFCRPEPGGPDRIFGYNEGGARWLIGPGYFQLVPTAGNAEFEGRGAWVVDYHQVPDGRVPDGWPWVVPNWLGPQVLVYNGTRDFMRKVSEHVCVGKPWSRLGALPFCFVLVRRD
jgi:hypothetical protein